MILDCLSGFLVVTVRDRSEREMTEVMFGVGTCPLLALNMAVGMSQGMPAASGRC